VTFDVLSQCIGSSQHLKSKFGKGSLLQLRVKNDDAAAAAAAAFVKDVFEGSKLTQQYRGSMSFEVT
jgi:hypothetical protein